MFNYSNINDTFGLIINNININKTTDENHKQLLLSLFYKYSLMIIPNQDIGKKDLINFTSIFGDPIEHPTNIKNRDIEFPQITIISNIKKNGFEIGALGSEEIDFHSDLVFCYKPGAVSILYCVDTPPTGGNTYWTDNISALKELNPDIKKIILNKKIIYKHRNDKYNEEPLACHSIICKHPISKNNYLFFSPSSAFKILEFNTVKPINIFEHLYEHITQNKFVIMHKWKKGDLIIWDNRTTMHKRDEFDEGMNRLMYRTQTIGNVSM